jgi:hypothetical protein
MRCWLVVLAALSSGSALAQPVTDGLADNEDPAVIALVNAKDQLVCTAAVIEPHTALTAAHCIVGDPLALRAFFGSAVLDGGTLIAVTDARAHPLFNPGGNDIAVLTLGEAAPAPPLLPASVNASLVDTSFRVVGFGLAGAKIGGAGVKRTGNARITRITAEDFTAVPGPSLACLGDSGGPALLPSGGIAGVVSRVDTECVDHAVYTRVDEALEPLIVPYLAETAAGTAGEGEPCFYAEHCSAGFECSDDRICETPSGGCGCRSSQPSSLLLAALLLVILRRRSA